MANLRGRNFLPEQRKLNRLLDGGEKDLKVVLARRNIKKLPKLIRLVPLAI